MVLPFGIDVPSPTDKFHKPLKSEDIGRIYTPLPQCFMHRFHTGAHIASQRYEGTRLNFCNKLKILMIQMYVLPVLACTDISTIYFTMILLYSSMTFLAFTSQECSICLCLQFSDKCFNNVLLPSNSFKIRAKSWAD